jgi:calcium-dependent protein kinase
MWDKDGCGKLCLNEIKGILGVGQSISEEFWQQIIQEVDSNGDGHVSLDEFKTMMKMLLKEEGGCAHHDHQ